MNNILEDALQYYKKEADKGHYHNPYTVDEELTEILDEISTTLSEWEYIEYEDKIHEVGLLFWEM